MLNSRRLLVPKSHRPRGVLHGVVASLNYLLAAAIISNVARVPPRNCHPASSTFQESGTRPTARRVEIKIKHALERSRSG